MNEDAYIEEQIPADQDAYALALQNEQAMRNMCPSDETRSLL
jgi:hypothetical protein